MDTLKLSVHQLVDFLLRKGSIDTRIYNQETMLEGTRIHLRYQSIQDGNYESEVLLLKEIEYEDFVVLLHGRADGIIHTKTLDIIDEIKSTNDDLEHFHEVQGEWHFGQAICYAYLYACQFDKKEMGVRLTYISQIDDSKLIKNEKYSLEQLEEKVYSFLKEYLNFYNLILNFRKRRTITSKELEFPYDEFRKSQRDIAKYVYKVSSDGGLFFFEAPTGTGKTISSLFPAIKTFANEKNEKIFYLSAKTQAKEVAHEAMKTMVKKGLDTRSIILSSKEQMCMCDEQKCDPDHCPFAIDYFEKINKVVKLVLENEKCIDKEKILKYATSYGICPFETQLDISTYCDVIICDYNYFFDPIVYLKRFFEESNTPYFALIDEAHNLHERTKDMYTVFIEIEKLMLLRASLQKIKSLKLKKAIRKLVEYMTLQINDEEYIVCERGFDEAFHSLVDKLYTKMQEFMKDNSDLVNSEFLDVFRMVNRFVKIREYQNEDFISYIENRNSNIIFYIRCVNSANLIKESFKQIRGAVLFSATLTPIDYYIKTLGGNENTPYLKLVSPFDKNNLLVMVRSDISTKYKDRIYTYKDVVESIKTVVNSKIGNYLVFFSSYDYLENVLERYPVGEENLIVQERDMKIKDRDNFLSNFVDSPEKTTVGFAVLGGVFSEGIDLVSDRLIGAIIVGVGLPMVSFERDIIKKYYDEKEQNGYEYAYINPGKNKVMQAAGRVIRSKDDRGIILLIDNRFMYKDYEDLFRLGWSHYKKVTSNSQILYHLNKFWSDK